MTRDKQADGKGEEPFLSRWARVKQDTQARANPVPDKPAASPSISAGNENTSIDAPVQPKMPEDALPERTLPDPSAPRELPSLDSLTPQSDFSAFMAKDVDPQLRNQAMKKLFTDPHYNVMDRLDTYIDDYSTHPPLTLEVIRQMSISKTLKLFDDEEDESAKVEGKPPAAPSAPATEGLIAAPQPQPVEAPTKPEVDADIGARPPPI